MAKKVFAMYLAKEGNPNSDAYAKLDLPASPWELWDALAKGQMNKQKLFQVRFGRFMQAMQLPDNGKGKAMNDRYEELLSTHADLLPGALTALEELSEVATLAIVSNGAVAVQEPRIAASGIDRYMDGGAVTDAERAIIERFHRNSEHKRVGRKDYRAN